MDLQRERLVWRGWTGTLRDRKCEASAHPGIVYDVIIDVDHDRLTYNTCQKWGFYERRVNVNLLKLPSDYSWL
jgi:hypothetical protein